MTAKGFLLEVVLKKPPCLMSPEEMPLISALILEAGIITLQHHCHSTPVWTQLRPKRTVGDFFPPF